MSGYSKEDQLKHNRRTPKRKARGEFSKKTKLEIYERDEGLCVRCGSPHLDSNPHHITFKSQGGEGDKRNGCCICRPCHTWAHNLKEGREWFENWRETNLDEKGDKV
jgi:5-methylcytosine-specific restriction endonuclease McrA